MVVIVNINAVMLTCYFSKNNLLSYQIKRCAKIFLRVHCSVTISYDKFI